jgi:hypothetical protein
MRNRLRADTYRSSTRADQPAEEEYPAESSQPESSPASAKHREEKPMAAKKKSAKRIDSLPDRKLDRRKAQSVRGGNTATPKMTVKFAPEYTKQEFKSGSS